jgi:hypothetical protein
MERARRPSINAGKSTLPALATLLSLLTLLALGACAGEGERTGSGTTATIGVGEWEVALLSVDPLQETIPVDSTLRYHATAVYGDGSEADVTSDVMWSRQGDAVGPVLGGVLIATQSGSAVVTATDRDSGLSASALVTVRGDEPVALQLTPDSGSVALGLPLQLAALGVLEDGSTVDLTGLVLWDLSDGALAALGVGGALTGLQVGTVLVTAVHPETGLRAQASVEITPAVLQSIVVLAERLTLPLGLRLPLQAVGHLSDGTTVDLTGLVDWNSADTQVAAVGAGGLVTALGLGDTVVTAVDPVTGLEGVLPLAVTPAVLESLQVLPAQTDVPLGLLTPLEAVGHYSDGTQADLTHAVQWSSANPLIAIVNGGGGVLGLLPGDASIHAVEPGSGHTASAAVSILGGLLGL